MGEQLKALFTRAREQGGIALAGKLALKSRLNSATAATQPDDPQTIAMVKQALDECLREQSKAPAAAPAAARPASAASGRLKNLYEFARAKGGVPLLVKLATKTGITSQMAETNPDDAVHAARLRLALVELLPGVQVPAA